MCFITLFFFSSFPPFSFPFLKSSFKFFPVFQFGQKIARIYIPAFGTIRYDIVMRIVNAPDVICYRLQLGRDRGKLSTIEMFPNLTYLCNHLGFQQRPCRKRGPHPTRQSRQMLQSAGRHISCFRIIG